MPQKIPNLGAHCEAPNTYCYCKFGSSVILYQKYDASIFASKISTERFYTGVVLLAPLRQKMPYKYITMDAITFVSKHEQIRYACESCSKLRRLSHQEVISRVLNALISGSSTCRSDQTKHRSLMV